MFFFFLSSILFKKFRDATYKQWEILELNYSIFGAFEVGGQD